MDFFVFFSEERWGKREKKPGPGKKEERNKERGSRIRRHFKKVLTSEPSSSVDTKHDVEWIAVG